MILDVVTHKEVVIALLGAAAGLAGLVLVFLGLIVSSYDSLPGATPGKVKTGLRRTAVIILVPFGVGIGCMLTATGWLLLLGGKQPLYVATVVLFLAQLGTLAAAAVWTVRALLWG